jgi:hypothetical protein
MPIKSRGASFGDLKKKLQALPVTVAYAAAQKAAPALTGEAQASHRSNQSVYGNPYPSGVDVHESGRTRELLRFAVNGRVVRVVLGARNKYGKEYQKYLIGKYGILPQGKRAIPANWTRTLNEIVTTTTREALKK